MNNNIGKITLLPRLLLLLIFLFINQPLTSLCGRVDFWDFDISYGLFSQPEQYRLYFSLQTSLTEEDYIIIVWPYPVLSNSSNPYPEYPKGQIIDYNTTQPITAQIPTETYDQDPSPIQFNTESDMMYFSFNTRLKTRKWYILEITIQPNTTLNYQAIDQAKTIQFITASGKSPSSFLYDTNYAFHRIMIESKFNYINIQPISQTEYNNDIGENILNQTIQVQFLQFSSQQFANFSLGSLIYIGFPNQQSELQFLNYCQVNGFSNNQVSCHIDQNYKRLIFDIKKDFSFDVYNNIELKMMIKLPTITSQNNFLTANWIGKNLIRNVQHSMIRPGYPLGEQQLNFYSQIYDIVNYEKKMFWNINQIEQIRDQVPAAVHISDIGNAYYVYNSLRVQFKVTKSNLAGEYNENQQNSATKSYYIVTIFNMDTDEILEGSFSHNFQSIESKQVHCQFIGNIAPKIIQCKFIKKLDKSLTHFIAFKAMYQSSRGSNIVAQINIEYFYYQKQLTQLVCQSPQFIFLSTSEFVQTQSFIDPGWMSMFGNTQVISVPDLSLETSLSNIFQRVDSSTLGTGVGLFSSRIHKQAIIFLIKVSVTNMVGAGYESDTNSQIQMNLLVNSNNIEIDESEPQSAGLQVECSDNSGVHTFNSLPCYASNHCTNYPGNQQNQRTNYPTQNAIIYKFKCGTTSNNPNNNCNIFRGRDTLNSQFSNGLITIRKTYLKQQFVPSFVLADETVVDFELTFNRVFSFNEYFKYFVSTSLIHGYFVTQNQGFAQSQQSFIQSYFVNFYTNNQGYQIPTMLRVKMHNVPNKVKIAVFFDQGISFDGYIDPNDNSYPCKIIVKNSTQDASVTPSLCIAYRGASHGATNTMANVNYQFNNILITDVVSYDTSTVSAGNTPYIELLFPIKTLQQTSLISPTCIHVALGAKAGELFAGIMSFAPFRLYTIYGPSPEGPNHRQALSSIQGLSYSQYSQIDLTGVEQLYEYTGTVGNLQMTYNEYYPGYLTAQITSGSATATDFFQKIPQVSTDPKGAGLTMISIGLDLFGGEIKLGKVSGVFPDQSGLCYKFQYQIKVPGNVLQQAIRFGLFCPLDGGYDISNEIQQMQIQMQSLFTGNLLNRVPPFESQYSTDEKIYFGFSERKGRGNLACAGPMIITKNLASINDFSMTINFDQPQFINFNTFIRPILVQIHIKIKTGMQIPIKYSIADEETLFVSLVDQAQFITNGILIATSLPCTLILANLTINPQINDILLNNKYLTCSSVSNDIPNNKYIIKIKNLNSSVVALVDDIVLSFYLTPPTTSPSTTGTANFQVSLALNNQYSLNSQAYFTFGTAITAGIPINSTIAAIVPNQLYIQLKPPKFTHPTLNLINEVELPFKLIIDTSVKQQQQILDDTLNPLFDYFLLDLQWLYQISNETECSILELNDNNITTISKDWLELNQLQQLILKRPISLLQNQQKQYILRIAGGFGPIQAFQNNQYSIKMKNDYLNGGSGGIIATNQISDQILYSAFTWISADSETLISGQIQTQFFIQGMRSYIKFNFSTQFNDITYNSRIYVQFSRSLIGSQNEMKSRHLACQINSIQVNCSMTNEWRIQINPRLVISKQEDIEITIAGFYIAQVNQKQLPITSKLYFIIDNDTELNNGVKEFGNLTLPAPYQYLNQQYPLDNIQNIFINSVIFQQQQFSGITKLTIELTFGYCPYYFNYLVVELPYISQVGPSNVQCIEPYNQQCTMSIDNKIQIPLTTQSNGQNVNIVLKNIPLPDNEESIYGPEQTLQQEYDNNTQQQNNSNITANQTDETQNETFEEVKNWYNKLKVYSIQTDQSLVQISQNRQNILTQLKFSGMWKEYYMGWYFYNFNDILYNNNQNGFIKQFHYNLTIPCGYFSKSMYLLEINQNALYNQNIEMYLNNYLDISSKFIFNQVPPDSSNQQKSFIAYKGQKYLKIDVGVLSDTPLGIYIFALKPDALQSNIYIVPQVHIKVIQQLCILKAEQNVYRAKPGQNFPKIRINFSPCYPATSNYTQFIIQANISDNNIATFISPNNPIFKIKKSGISTQEYIQYQIQATLKGTGKQTQINFAIAENFSTFIQIQPITIIVEKINNYFTDFVGEGSRFYNGIYGLSSIEKEINIYFISQTQALFQVLCQRQILIYYFLSLHGRQKYNQTVSDILLLAELSSQTVNNNYNSNKFGIWNCQPETLEPQGFNNLIPGQQYLLRLYTSHELFKEIQFQTKQNMNSLIQIKFNTYTTSWEDSVCSINYALKLEKYRYYLPYNLNFEQFNCPIQQQRLRSLEQEQTNLQMLGILNRRNIQTYIGGNQDKIIFILPDLATDNDKTLDNVNNILVKNQLQTLQYIFAQYHFNYFQLVSITNYQQFSYDTNPLPRISDIQYPSETSIKVEFQMTNGDGYLFVGLRQEIIYSDIDFSYGQMVLDSRYFLSGQQNLMKQDTTFTYQCQIKKDDIYYLYFASALPDLRTSNNILKNVQYQKVGTYTTYDGDMLIIQIFVPLGGILIIALSYLGYKEYQRRKLLKTNPIEKQENPDLQKETDSVIKKSLFKLKKKSINKALDQQQQLSQSQIGNQNRNLKIEVTNSKDGNIAQTNQVMKLQDVADQLGLDKIDENVEEIIIM